MGHRMEEWKSLESPSREEGTNTQQYIHTQQNSTASKMRKPDSTKQFASISKTYHREKRQDAK